MTTDTFDYFDGWLCVRHTDTHDSEPLRAIMHWPICKCSLSDVEHMIGKPAERSRGDYSGTYIFTPDEARWQFVTYRLKDGGQTKPISFTTEPVPPPKSKRETRWHYGQWQKHFATGWQNA